MSTNIIERTSNIKTRAIFSKDGRKRYLLEIIFGEEKEKPRACIIMTYPSTADEYILDQTTMLVRNNSVWQNYASISIVNLFCGLDMNKPETDRMNSSVLAEECSKADIVLIAYGRGACHAEEKERLLEALKPYSEKLYTITDQPFTHPLSPKAREWKVTKL